MTCRYICMFVFHMFNLRQILRTKCFLCSPYGSLNTLKIKILEFFHLLTDYHRSAEGQSAPRLFQNLLERFPA